MQDLNDKITGGTLTAAEWNEVPSELQNVITGLGMSLSSFNLNQLGKGIAGYAGSGDFYSESGAVNAYVLTALGSKQAPPSLADGMRIRFKTANANTGPSTINVAGIGVKDLRLIGGGVFTGGEIVPDRYVTGIFSTSGDYFEIEGPVIDTDIVVSIPSDYPTLQLAIDSLFLDTYKGDASISINIETGHKLTAGLKLVNGDYSRVSITSTDATVTLAAGFVPVATEDSPGATDMVFVFHQCIAPRINILLDIEAKLFNGVSGTGNSTVFFSVGAGIKNAGVAKSNVLGTNFNLKAQGAIFSGAGFRDVWLSAVCTADMDGADCSNAGDIGLFASRSSRVHFNGGIVDGCDIGIRSSSTSAVMAQGISAVGCITQAVFATFAGKVYCGAATITGSLLDGLVASEGGSIDAREATVTGSANINVNAFNGGRISITGGVATGGGVWDLSIASGGYIFAEGTTGTPRVTANTLTARGVIFQ